MIMKMMINTRTTIINEEHHSFPTWKVYENPFYICPQTHHHNQQIKQEQEDQNKQLHLLHLPVSTRKIASSFWDLTFINPFMDSELDTARAQIMELKAQLEYERKARKKAESLNKKLTKEVFGERKEREELERVCEELACELTSSRSEISRLKMEMEEERKMLRVAEVIREERVQMKLSEAKIMLEEKISELEITKMTHKNNVDQEQEEPENPHIKRGIRGFVEFPRVVRAIRSRSRHLGRKPECQKVQLMILLKQKTQIQSNNLILS
ncbi:hypothetical protein L1987_05152 [Smallanthus sonchifolius]|uniref:Uncharacterized protein n=1 Tax=Smallanthus sonchifolius TaxID=185202 RepID=A0ACB9JUS0_9ASTR|nr:hypothetical protein L1987_05152 [Smallanthus sonchifolius]